MSVLMTSTRLLTIYDLEVQLSFEGSDAGGADVKGTIKCPEVSHEAVDGLSEYVVSRCLLILPWIITSLSTLLLRLY